MVKIDRIKVKKILLSIICAYLFVELIIQVIKIIKNKNYHGGGTMLTIDRQINEMTENSLRSELSSQEFQNIIAKLSNKRKIESLTSLTFIDGHSPCIIDSKINKIVISPEVLDSLQLLFLEKFHQNISHNDKNYMIEQVSFIDFKYTSDGIIKIELLLTVYRNLKNYGFQCKIEYLLTPINKKDGPSIANRIHKIVAVAAATTKKNSNNLAKTGKIIKNQNHEKISKNDDMISNIDNSNIDKVLLNIDLDKVEIDILNTTWIGLIMSEHLNNQTRAYNRENNLLQINRLFPEGKETNIDKGYYRVNNLEDTKILDSNIDTTNQNINFKVESGNIEPVEQCFRVNGTVYYDRLFQQDCLNGVDGKGALGIWDKPCQFDSECPFWNSNNVRSKFNPDKIYGGCIKEGNKKGFCEMPINVMPLAYKKFLRDGLEYEPHCYKTVNSKTTVGPFCRNQDIPDYAFVGDRQDRIYDNRNVN